MSSQVVALPTGPFDPPLVDRQPLEPRAPTRTSPTSNESDTSEAKNFVELPMTRATCPVRGRRQMHEARSDAQLVAKPRGQRSTLVIYQRAAAATSECDTTSSTGPPGGQRSTGGHRIAGTCRSRGPSGGRRRLPHVSRDSDCAVEWPCGDDKARATTGEGYVSGDQPEDGLRTC